MPINTRWISAAMAVTFIVSAVAAPISANASEDGKRNTTLGLGAAAAGLLLTQKNKLPGLLAAGGAVYAYGQYQNDVNKRHRRERAAAYRHGYSRGASYSRLHRRVSRR